MQLSFKFILFSSILISLFCSKRLIKKDELYLVNEYYSQNTYKLKEDISFSNKDILKKDTLLKIWVESTATILKIKAYKLDEDRESAIGKMITYQINDEFREKKFTVEYLDNLINQKLEIVDQKDKKINLK
jgi:type II secretion system-associated lipoprotein